MTSTALPDQFVTYVRLLPTFSEDLAIGMGFAAEIIVERLALRYGRVLGSVETFMSRLNGLKLRSSRSWSCFTPLVFASGQAAVEFTLTFMLFLIIAWIPADFGLAFYSGQIAQNAAREGARIAAADSTLASGTTSCIMPGCTGNIFRETAARLSSALLPAATITLKLDPDTGTNCNRMVTVTVSGTYKFFFYQLLHVVGVSGDFNSTPILRQTSMRWEAQAGCF